MWFIFALCAILAWSGSDLFSKLGSRPEDKYSHWKMVAAVGIIMGIHALYMIFSSEEAYELTSLLTYLPISALYIGSMTFGYIGLRYIELSISSPICNSSGALVAVLCFVFLKQTMDIPQIFAVVAICVGVIALAVVENKQDESLRTERREKSNVKYVKSVKAILFPVIYLVLDALGTYFDAFYLDGEEPILNEFQANTSYELTFLICGIIAIIYIFGIKRQRIQVKSDAPKAVAGICETAGQFAYVYALASNAIVAAPMIASYSAVSLLWARIILKEKLTKWHYMCLACVFAGIITLGIVEGLEG